MTFLQDHFTKPTKDDLSDFGSPAPGAFDREEKKSPWQRYREKREGLRSVFWSPLAKPKRDEFMQEGERRDYAEWFQSRVKAIEALRNDPWPSSFRDVAKEAFDAIPRGILLDYARSDMEDDLMLDRVRAFVGMKIRDEARKRYDELSDSQKVRADFIARNPSANEVRFQRLGHGEELLPSELDLTPEERAALILKKQGPARTLPEVETAQLASMFGFSTKSIRNAVDDHGAWLSDKILNNVAMEALVKVADAGGRALDWLAQQASGQEDKTFGQIVFSPLEKASPEAFTVLSGTTDAAKIFYLDTFVIFGKATKFAKAARGLGRVDDYKDAVAAVEKGINSAPVDRFAKWWTKLPDELRTPGYGQRNAEMFGWKVKPEAWNRLSQARSTNEVKNVLHQESLAVGPSRVQNIEALPYLRPSHRVRRAWEGDFGKVSLENKLLGPFRTVWGNKLDPTTPVFDKQLRRFGDFMWGTKTPTDEAARIVDGHVGRITRISDKSARTQAMSQFLEDGLSAYATRLGASPEDAAKALEQARGSYPGFLGRAKTTAYGFDAAGETIQTPFRQTQIANAIPVPSYMDMLAYKTELLDVMGKSARATTRRAAKKVGDGLAVLTRGVIRVWLAKPSTLLRAGVEETFDLAGHPEFGRIFRRQKMEDKLDWASGMFHRGHGRRADASADMRRELFMEQGYRGHVGIASSSLDDDIAQELTKAADELDLDRFHWKPVDQGDATFSYAWYHVVNHQVLQDPLSAIVVSYADDIDTARQMGRMWLDTPEGQKYLRQLPSPGDAATKAEDILNWHVADVQRNIPDELLPAAQGALASGTKVSLEDLERAHTAGRAPSRVVGPVPVSELPAAEAKRLGYFQGNPATDLLQKPYTLGARWGDAMSRRPGYRAAKTYRKEGLERLRATRKKYGVDWGMSDDFIEKEATHYANREMWRMDNPLERSRSDFWLRNVSPFQYNQNNFMKRWGRRAVTNPGYVSRLRNMVGAMEDIGFVQKDENGNLTFQIPISAEFYSSLLKRRKDMPKHYARLAFSLGFGGVSSGAGIFKEAPFDLFRQLALPPGMPFAASVDPGFGPVLTIPVQALTANKPKLDWARNWFLGGFEQWDPEKGGWQNLLHSVGASWLRDIGAAVTGEEGDRAFVSTVKDLVAYAEFSGNDDIYDPKNRDKYEKQAQWFFLVRGLSKAIFPYAVTSPVFMEERDELEKLIDEYDYEEGTARFLEKYDGKGMSLLTAVSGGAPMKGAEHAPKFLLAATPYAEEFYRNNPEFFKAFPNVAGLFTNRKGDEYEPTALRRQMQRGQRLGRNMAEFWTQLNIEAGTHEYFDGVIPFLDELRARGVDSEKISAIRQHSIATLDKLFPGTRVYLAEWSTNREIKDMALEELRAAVKDPLVKDRKDVKPLTTFLSYHDSFLADVKAKYGIGAQLARAKRTANYRAALVHIYNRLQEQSGSQVLEKAYTYLFRADLEDQDDEETSK